LEEEWVSEEKGVERSLPYGIKPVPVYYICAYCGKLVTSEDLAKMPSLMCPNCGQRIFVKSRAPPQTGFIRRVKAV
jgi:DNA-directed RNA polymerase subunit P